MPKIIHWLVGVLSLTSPADNQAIPKAMPKDGPPVPALSISGENSSRLPLPPLSPRF
ncbi:MAG: hypothetical protein ACON5N_00855 [Akkermansiaceae bacterium]